MDGSYALSDLDGDGYEELILALMDGNVETIVTYDGEQTSLILKVRRLRTIYIPNNVKWWLAEGNILVNQVTCGSCQRYAYYRLENGEYKLFDVVEYHDETKSWSRSQDGDEICELELSEAEAKEITGSYTPMNLNFKPVSEFPRD